MMRKIGLLAVASSLLAGAQAVAGGSMDPAMLSNTCAGCHGTHGASAGLAMPTIGGQSELFLAEAMNHYAKGTRHSTVMGRIAKGYDSNQIKAIAKFYAAQPWVSAKQEIDAAKVKQGQQIHMAKGCVGCHGATGVAPSPNTPRLAGQWAEYLVLSMGHYQNDKVAIPPTAMPMRIMLKSMSGEEIEALAQFYASQQ